MVSSSKMLSRIDRQYSQNKSKHSLLQKGDFVMSRNPLNSGNTPSEPVKGERVINVVTQKIVRVAQEDGDVRDFVVQEKVSRPHGDGTYIDTEIHTLPVDRAGNPLPEDFRSTSFSHSGLFTDEQYKGECNYWLHSGDRKIIRIGQDGRMAQNGAICSRCEFWKRTIWIAVSILVAAGILGVYRGLDYF